MANFIWPNLLILLLIILTILSQPTNGDTLPLIPNTSIKCGCSSCSPCIQTSPPPPPSLPPPPPLCPPPPPPKKPPTPSQNCPPPPLFPYPPFIYIPGPPGNLYPVDDNFSGSSRTLEAGLMMVVMCGLVGVVLAHW